MNKIVFIGAGNVATALAKNLQGKCDIIQVFSKSAAPAKRLANSLKCPYTINLNKITPLAGIYIIAVKDDAIKEVANAMQGIPALKNKIVVHTSGSVEMGVLKKISSYYGVLYPLQTFSRSRESLPGFSTKGIPFCIECSNREVKKELEKLVAKLGGKCYEMDSHKRAKLHLAAVFVNNFTNHLFSIGCSLLKEENIPFQILMPLIEETLNKLKTKTPAQSQTGPAIRNDIKTIKKHELMLKNKPAVLAIYKLLTKSIRNFGNFQN